MDQILTLFNTDSEHKLVNEILQNHYDVKSFNRGIEAYTWMHSGHIPDLIIAHVTLTDMDVKELICRFKNSSYYSEIPILLLPQSIDTDLIDDLLKNGADDYVSYPLKEDLFLISVRNLLLKK